MDVSEIQTDDVVTIDQKLIIGNTLAVKENKHYRWFEYAGHSIQSLMSRDKPHHLMIPVTQALMLFFLFKKTPLRLLNLGLGGGGLERLLANFPDISITSVESSQDIIEMAKQHFYLPEKIEVVCQDAFQFVKQNQDPFDVIISDLFIGEKNPAFLFSAEFFQRLVNITTKDSVITLNIKAESNQHLFQVLSTIKTFFPYIALIEFDDYSNLVVVASKVMIPHQQTLQQNLINRAELAALNLEVAIKHMVYIPPGSSRT
jgi:spermidine synthase